MAQPLLENNPQQAYIFFQKGLIKLLEKNYQGAINDFNQAITLNPNYAQAYYHRGRIYAGYAFGTNSSPHELPPGCSWVNQVIVCPIDFTKKWREENLVNALKDLDKSLELNPNYAPSYYQKGLIFEANQQPKEAIAAFQKATNLYSFEGLNYLGINQPQQAADFLNYSNLSEQKIQAIVLLKSPTGSASSQEYIGGSTQSPERKKSPEELFSEGCNLIKIPDYVAALQKFRQASRLFQESKNQKRYQETQKIIRALEKY
jgi:tetratricopeptide (TPR) repeat protein